MDWKEQKNAEMQFLLKEYGKRPELFEFVTFVDNAAFLADFGIHIPNKELFPNAYLKLFPQDFIVEEVTREGVLLTADKVPNLSGPETEGDTVYATLVKCNISTFDAVKEIARQLGIKMEQVQYAGIKDKNAITSQRISIRRVPKGQVAAVRSDFFFLKDVSVGKGVVERGALRGNHFSIILRTEAGHISEDQRNAMLRGFDSVIKNGFYNFFYLQRFASPRLTSYRWGYHLLTGNYSEAVRERLFAPGLRESRYFQELRTRLGIHFGDWEKVKEGFSPFPLMCRQEIALIDHLLINPDDYLGALKQIPDQVGMWIQSIGSLLFNQLLSNLIVRSEVPEELPIFLSSSPSYWEPYKAELQGLGIFPPPIRNLRPFSINLNGAIIKTVDHPDIQDIKIVPEGVVMQFELKKGEYATTFLSHLFNLTSGKPPAEISREPVNIKDILGNSEFKFKETLDIFSPIIHPMVDNFIEMFKNQE